jgi:heat shock 70kDa protein 1/2/6/8
LSLNARAVCRLRIACESAKCTLSSATRAIIELDNLFEGVDFYTSITRTRFEELCSDLFRGTLDSMEKVLRDSKIDKAKVHEIVLAGGSTRIPRIAKLVSDFFNGKEPSRSINPDEGPAYGVAVLAAMSSGHTSDKTQNVLFLEAVPKSLGIGTAGGVMTPLIRRNTSAPYKRSENFSTFYDNQSSVLVEVYEGERARTRDNLLIGRLRLSGIPPAPRGVPKIEVTFDVGWHGKSLNVSVLDKTTGRSNRTTIGNDITIVNDQGYLNVKDEINMLRHGGETITCWLDPSTSYT